MLCLGEKFTQRFNPHMCVSLLPHPLVICSFRGTVPQGLVLELGETVQILEKCEGKCDVQEGIPFFYGRICKCFNLADFNKLFANHDASNQST